MHDYRTKMFDGQISFGSGSNVNANDIPESTTRFWLTNLPQEISGSKIFEDDLISNGNIYVNYNGPDSDSYLYFYENGGPAGAYLMWDDDPGEFKFNQKVKLVKSNYADIHLQATDADSNARFVLQNDARQYTCGITGDDYFAILDDTASVYRLRIDTTGRVGLGQSYPAQKLEVNGSIAAADDMYINFRGGDGDSHLYFYENSSNTGASLMWDDDPGNFVLNKAIKIGDSTNYTEIKDDGEINLHGTARVNRHVRVAAPSWKKGATAPIDNQVGIFPTLAFDNSSDDSVYYDLIIPFRMAAGAEIGVTIDWCYTGAQDNGTVCWGMEYLTCPSGSVIDGSTTTITETSPVNQMAGRLIRTEFTTGITGAVAHDALGIRLYRDVSEDTLNTDAELIEAHFEFLTDKLGEAT